MFKIYPDKYTYNQLIIPSINGEIIFTLFQDNLEIIYGEMHMKIQKDTVKKVVIKECIKNNFKKIFLKLENNSIIEYILFSSNIELIKLKEFFKKFNLINEK